MFPLCQFACQRKYKRNIHRCILHGDAFVRATSKDKIVLRILVRRAFRVKPAFGREYIGVGEHIGIVQRFVKRWYNHATSGYRVVTRNRERLLGKVGHLHTE